MAPKASTYFSYFERNLTLTLSVLYIGLSKRGYELEFDIAQIFGMEKYIIDHTDFFDNRITKTS